MTAFMGIGRLMPTVGLAENLGGLLIIISRTRALGALIILPVMVGVLLTNIAQEISDLSMALVSVSILIWILYDNKEKYLPLIKKSQTIKTH